MAGKRGTFHRRACGVVARLGNDVEVSAPWNHSVEGGGPARNHTRLLVDGCWLRGGVVNNFTGVSEAFRVLSLPEHAKKLSEDDGNDQIVEQAEISAVVLAKSGVYPRWARCKKVCVVCRQRCGEVGHHGR